MSGMIEKWYNKSHALRREIKVSRVTHSLADVGAIIRGGVQFGEIHARQTATETEVSGLREDVAKLTTSIVDLAREVREAL